jgi:hypothetical protein
VLCSYKRRVLSAPRNRMLKAGSKVSQHLNPYQSGHNKAATSCSRSTQQRWHVNGTCGVLAVQVCYRPSTSCIIAASCTCST